MPDLATFDNRDNAAFNKLIDAKMRSQAKGIPINSMGNLNVQEKETLPIYKRRAKGPVKITESSYNNRPLNLNHNSKRDDGIFKNKINHSGEENINNTNQVKQKSSKSKSTRIGRQQTEFRINRNRTSNNRKLPVQNTVTSYSNLKTDEKLSKLPASKSSRMPDKRAHSQHNTRQKVKIIQSPDEPQDVIKDLDMIKSTIKNNFINDAQQTIINDEKLKENIEPKQDSNGKLFL